MCDCDECPICRSCGCEHQKEKRKEEGWVYDIFDLCEKHAFADHDKDRERAERLVGRSLFKYTSCGISFNHQPPLNESYGHVSVAGYCEGWDGEHPSHVLSFPFKHSEFEKEVDAADKEGCVTWNETHGCEKCGGENPETGYTPINPDCKHCAGAGVSI
jgi:hypothetical protein